MRRPRILLATAPFALAAIIAGSASAASTNLVGDGDFSDGIAAWNDWDPETTSATITSGGAISLQAKAPTAPGQWAGLSQCIALPSDAIPYEVSAKVVIPGGQGRSGHASLRVQAWGTPTCSNPGAQLRDYQIGVPGTHHVSYEVTPFTGAKALRISIAADMGKASPDQDPSAAFRVEFDDVAIVAKGEIPAPALTSTPTPPPPQATSVTPVPAAATPVQPTSTGTPPKPSSTATPTISASSTAAAASEATETAAGVSPTAGVTKVPSSPTPAVTAGATASPGGESSSEGGGYSGAVIPIGMGLLVLGGIGTTAFAIRRRRQ